MKNFVLCGSMKFKEDIISIGQKIEDMGFKVLLPVECINGEPKEIAFAFFHNKKIFLLNDIYEPFKDELEGWKAITLNSKLEDIK